jgi:hypothetical protein
MDRLSPMNKYMKFIFISKILLGFLLFSCKTPEEPSEPVKSEPEPPAEIVSTAEEEPETKIEPATIINNETGFEVTKEVYEQTLDEMRKLIDTLNDIISNQNYEKWKLFLSKEYIKTYNNPVRLSQLAEQSQILSENNISLENLKDYFEWVVVPSRSDARVDDIVFIDDSHLVVYMVIKEKNTILYQLEKTNEKWEISFW